jgi:hypothetical protein
MKKNVFHLHKARVKESPKQQVRTREGAGVKQQQKSWHGAMNKVVFMFTLRKDFKMRNVKNCTKAGSVAQWQSACLACKRPWVSPHPKKKRCA